MTQNFQKIDKIFNNYLSGLTKHALMKETNKVYFKLLEILKSTYSLVSRVYKDSIRFMQTTSINDVQDAHSITHQPYNQLQYYKYGNENTFNMQNHQPHRPIQQMNKKIAQYTQQIRNSKSRYKHSFTNHHKFSNQQSHRSSFKPYVEFQSPRSSLQNYNCGPQLPYFQSNFKKRRENPFQGMNPFTKINFIYNHRQKPQTDIIRNPATNSITQKSYQSIQLILGKSRDKIESKDDEKRDIRFSFMNKDSQQDDNKLNSKSSINYANKQKKQSPYKRLQLLQSGSSNPWTLKRTKSYEAWEQSQDLNKKPHLTQNIFEDRKSKKLTKEKDLFYDMKDAKQKGSKEVVYNQNGLKQKMSGELKITNSNFEALKRISVNSQSLIKSRKLIESNISSKQNLTETTKPKEIMVYKTEIGPEKRNNSLSILMSRIKDKESRLIAVSLILLAFIIFLMQLVS